MQGIHSAPVIVDEAQRITEAPLPFQKRILFALNARGGHIYAGTVPPEEIARRRKHNKMARVSRRINRSRR